jgi:hypothetical protein
LHSVFGAWQLDEGAGLSEVPPQRHSLPQHPLSSLCSWSSASSSVNPVFLLSQESGGSTHFTIEETDAKPAEGTHPFISVFTGGMGSQHGPRHLFAPNVCVLGLLDSAS